VEPYGLAKFSLKNTAIKKKWEGRVPFIIGMTCKSVQQISASDNTDNKKTCIFYLAAFPVH